jgi:glutathione synthase/RimK-type ligase-like ATP-grasp enzyme
VEFNSGDEQPIPAAPLYTLYIPKKAEYRFHVFDGQVIDVQQKKKKRGSDVDHRIRNLHNGYVYCRDGVSPPDGAAALAVRAVEACGYLYGAVDVIYNEKRACSYVLEVNSRPGIINQTCDSYADAIINCFNLSVRSVV